MRTFRSIAFVLISAAPVGACLDLSPLPYEGPEGGAQDASIADVALDVNGADAFGGTCAQCLRAACKSPEMACEQNAKCLKFAVCATETQCWGASLTNLADLPPCLVQCGSSAGLTGQADPAAPLVGPVLSCAQDPNTCASACLGAADK